MGLIIAIALASTICIVAVLFRREIIAYSLLAMIVFFSELGADFTSFNGSFVFNQEFINFYKLKLVEIVIGITWFFTLLTQKSKANAIFKVEKRLLGVFALLITLLSLLEYSLHGSVTISDWRLIVSGVFLFHIFAMHINSEKKLVLFANLFLIFLTARAIYGLALYWAGYGIINPRGVAPFFWDSRQIGAFAFGAILLTTYLVSYKSSPTRSRVLHSALAIVGIVVLTLTVLLSMRRSIWFIEIGGVVLILLTSKRVRIQHVLVISFVIIFGTLLLALSTSNDFRTRMGDYIASTNILDKTVVQQALNDVHVDNVVQYSQMIVKNPAIFLFGFRAYEASGYNDLRTMYSSEKYELGVAHNGLLRSIYFFGIAGMVIYVLIFVLAFMLVRKINQISNRSPLKYLGVGSLVFLFMGFLPTLIFTPPFYTTVKGLTYVFIAIIFLRTSLYYSSVLTYSIRKKSNNDLNRTLLSVFSDRND